MSEMTPAHSPLIAWDRVTGAFSRRPVFNPLRGPLIARDSCGVHMLIDKMQPGARIGAAVAVVFFWGVTTGFWFGAGNLFGLLGFLFAVAVASAATLGVFIAMFRRSEVRFLPAEQRLEVSYGFLGRKHMATSLEGVEARLTLEDGSRSEKGKGQCSLELLGPGGRRVVLARHKDRTKLQDAFAALGQWLGQAGVDETVQAVSLPGLVEAKEVSRCALPALTSNFRFRMIDFRDDDAVVVVSGEGKVILGLFLVVGIAAILAGAILLAYCAAQFAWPLLGAGACCLVLGAALAAAGLLTLRKKWAVFDRWRHVFVLPGSWKTKPRAWSLKDIVAIQVCLQYVPGDSDTSPYTAYQLNVVLRGPGEDRVNVLAQGNREALFLDARRLAELLGVPLLDHAQEGA